MKQSFWLVPFLDLSHNKNLKQCLFTYLATLKPQPGRVGLRLYVVFSVKEIEVGMIFILMTPIRRRLIFPDETERDS